MPMYVSFDFSYLQQNRPVRPRSDKKLFKEEQKKHRGEIRNNCVKRILK